MITIYFDEAKNRINELIDEYSSEIINDFLNEIKSYAETGNIRDIELTVDSIRDIEKKSFEMKLDILKAKSVQEIFLTLKCDIFDDYDGTILSKLIDDVIIIKK